MRVLAIDPGNKVSGWAIMSGPTELNSRGISDNEDLVDLILSETDDVDSVAIEFPSPPGRGNSVFKEVLETAAWAGDFERCANIAGLGIYRCSRSTVKASLLGTVRGNDASVRRRIIERFGLNPDTYHHSQITPLFGVKSHIWAAIAVGMLFFEGVNDD